jgi:hypothetical protein
MRSNRAAGTAGWGKVAGAAFLALGATMFSELASAEEGLFAGLAGSWRGEGSLKWATGENERMRCTAKYEVTEDGNKIEQDMVCATDSTRLVVKSDITYRPAAGVITGQWSERGYGINGWVTGTAKTGSIDANVESRDKSFSAKVGIMMQEGSQIVTIQPKNLDVTEALVTMEPTS